MAETNPHRVTSIGRFASHTVADNHQIVINRGGVTPHTTVVRFTYGVTVRNRNGPDDDNAFRANTVLIERPSALPHGYSEWNDWLADAIRDALPNNFEAISNYDGDDPVSLRLVDGQPIVKIVERSDVLTNDDVVRHLGLSVPPPPSRTRMHGWNDEQQPQHRAFRYMIEGCDMNTLQGIVPGEWVDGHWQECERMCAYRMLGDLNTVPGRLDPPKVFRPVEINRWLNQNGHAVGGLYDGLCSDDIQAHAIHFRYGHCAMDLSRSVLNLYIPESTKERNHHYKTACYVVVGDHCQPIVDSNIVKSVMKSASARVGQRRLTGYHNGLVFQPNNRTKAAVNSNPASPAPPTTAPTSQATTTTTNRRKRHRSLDRVFRPAYDKSEDRQLQDLWRASNHDTPVDLNVDDWEDDFSDTGSHLSLGSDNHPGGGAVPLHRRFKLPLVTDRDRFHFFTKENDIPLIEARCKPTYREGDDTTIIHYYICTDDDDVEFLYQYCIRVLKIDPMRYARSFNGRCRQIRMQNTWWSASKDIHQTMKLHEVLAPAEPFQPSGMATYAFRMLHKELCRTTKRSGALWECMSHYPPNLQRLLDTAHPFQRPKLMQCTFNPPYSNPTTFKPGSSTPTPPETLIPEAHRRRIDLIRSYASTIRNLGHGDQYPIHDPTNTVVPYDETLHGSIPIGHYLVDIPTEDMVLGRHVASPTDSANANGGADVVNSDAGDYGTLDDWKKLICLPLGQARMMTHRMLRALLHRRMLTKSCIRLVCAVDPVRQGRNGLALVLALQTVLETIYRHPAMQTGEICPKHLINHLVGLCNGTSSPHSGMRYVFHDIKHLYNLLTQIVSEDQMRRIRVCHTTGYDPLWHKSFSYYEIDSSGLAYKSLHLQPVYNMVLEDQAIRVFDIVRPIPIPHLIQINIDAVEYHVHDPRMLPPWAQLLADQTVSEDEYNRLTPELMYEAYMGRFRCEKLKGPERAQTYYYKFQTVPNLQATMNRFYSGRLGAPRDTESIDWVANWRDTLRVVPTPAATGQSQSTILQQLLVDIFQDVRTSTIPTEEDAEKRLNLPKELPESRPGLLVTGPAGTGKTHFIRLIDSFASNLGLSVVKSAYTHAACVQMGCDAVTLSSLFGLDEKADVRCTMALSRRFGAQLRALDIDVLIIDEISMIPLLILEVLMLFHRVSPKTRLCLVGDFRQLPPVEPGWDRKDDYDYFHQTDIFPYLLYDRVRNQPGRWLQLTECMRTSDPLLMRICQNPDSVQAIQPTDFPMPSLGIPIWRFISWRNSTRKACNFYCMHRFLQMHPEATRIRLSLRDLYARKKQEDAQRAGQKRPQTDPSTTTTTGIETFAQMFDKLTYRPPHWKYLQPNYTYAVGMEVVCRNTMREWDGGNLDNNLTNNTNAVVNNRRARIVEMDLDKQTVTIRWMDIIRKFQDNNDEDFEDASVDDVTLTYHDFAFNFVPGFCITAHMAQGETIREHYAVMEWPEMVTNLRMAYVVVTRGSSSQFLHIVPNKFADPWNSANDTTNENDNILRKLYHLYAWDKDSPFELDIEHVAQKMRDQNNVCALCKKTQLVTTRYNYKSQEQFMITSIDSATKGSVTLTNLCVCCNACYGNRLRVGNKNKPL